MGFPLAHVSPDVLKLNPDLAAALEPAAAGMGEAKSVQVADGEEREFQAAAELWLVGHGYGRRTEGNTAPAHWPERGWFLHLHRTVGNPLLLDLMILGHDGRWLEIELKTEKGAVRPWQSRMVRQSKQAVLVRDMAGFVGAVLGWEENRFEQNNRRS